MDIQSDTQPPSNTTGLQLLQVHAYFRHGDRSPTPLGEAKARAKLWETRLQEVPLILQKREYFPQKFPWGLLTVKGAEQSKALGSWLRELYLPEFCGPEYDIRNLQSPEKPVIQLRSTNFLRTHLTAWFVLEGLLGSPEAAASVPISCRDEVDENLYHNDDHCPRLKKQWYTAWRRACESVGADGKKWHSHFKKMQDAMTQALEISLDKPGFLLPMDQPGFPWVKAVDTLECGRFHGDMLPPGISDDQITEVRRLLARDYALTFQDREILQLAVGRLVRELVDAMSECGTIPTLFLYSGHDATIMPLSVALGVPWADWPAYTSCICVELWQSGGGNYFVRVLYDGKGVALPLSREDGALKKEILTLDEFREIANWSMISEAEYSCKCEDMSGLVEGSRSSAV